jgi:hypothetical protein
MSKVILELEGNVNDLLSVDNERNLKMTRFVLDSNAEPDDEETVDVTITSVDQSRTHKIFNEGLLNKKVKITIEEI